ncbi:MAG: hypothetical protein C0462_08605 [Alcanivorax sp.]|nr:hypothetical protein [Alcanivorax sp.]
MNRTAIITTVSDSDQCGHHAVPCYRSLGMTRPLFKGLGAGGHRMHPPTIRSTIAALDQQE